MKLTDLEDKVPNEATKLVTTQDGGGVVSISAASEIIRGSVTDIVTPFTLSATGLPGYLSRSGTSSGDPTYAADFIYADSKAFLPIPGTAFSFDIDSAVVNWALSTPERAVTGEKSASITIYCAFITMVGGTSIQNGWTGKNSNVVYGPYGIGSIEYFHEDEGTVGIGQIKQGTFDGAVNISSHAIAIGMFSEPVYLVLGARISSGSLYLNSARSSLLNSYWSHSITGRFHTYTI